MSSDTGWHRHDNGTVHRDDAGCTWLGNPVPVPAPPTYVPRPCPECVVGKHDICAREAWDDDADQPTECPCYAAGHPTEVSPGVDFPYPD